ncbi:MAG TPA: porin [Gallionella sp.]|nr:porin [Gallionella sp.]
MCRRNLALLAIVLATLPPAAAADSPISIFGKLDADVESVRSSQPGAGIASARNRIATNASRIGVRGSKDVEDGRQVVWQLATRVNLNGTETGGGGGLFTLWGNSRIGLQGRFGTLFLGVWDTPFRQAYDKVDLFDNSHIASPMAVLGSIGNGIGVASTIPTAAQGFSPAVDSVTVASTGFYRRQKSSLQYWSPVSRHLQFKLAYSVDDPGNRTVAANPSLWSLSAAYDREPLYLAMAYERHQDLKVLAGANVRGTDTGERLIGAYRIGDGKVGLVYERLSFSTLGAGSTARNALSLSGSYRFDDNSLGAVYTRAGDLSGTAGTGANQFSLRYGYVLFDGAELYGQYTAIRNRANGTYNFGDGLNIATSSGATISGLGMGVAYAF